MGAALRGSRHQQHVERIAGKAIGPAARVEVLEARLTACVAVMEALIETHRVDSECHETLKRVIRHSRQALDQ